MIRSSLSQGLTGRNEVVSESGNKMEGKKHMVTGKVEVSKSTKWTYARSESRRSAWREEASGQRREGSRSRECTVPRWVRKVGR